jgi:hypothetical protein
MSKIDLNRGEYRVIRVDGSEELVSERPSLAKIYRDIGCTCIDTVTLTRNAHGPDIIMLVDDEGMIINKPVNPKATALYHSVCRPGAVYGIHGDVALIHDRDLR